MKISVIGTGYLGITHAVCMAHLGHDVTGFDVNYERIEAQKSGKPTIFEPDLSEMLVAALDKNLISFSTLESDLSEADLHFICVGTPQSSDSEKADLSQIYSVIDMLCRSAKVGSIIVGKSTIPMGTVKKIEEILSERNRSDINVVWNPEFLREGHAVFDTLSPSRIVIGGRESKAASFVASIYSDLFRRGVALIQTDPETAELVKLAANSFLAVKISFINGFSQLCAESGANPNTLAFAIGLDERIGPHFLKPGLGFGGACLPKDLHSTTAIAQASGAPSLGALLTAADQINMEMRSVAVELIMSTANELGTRKIGVLGMTFKPGTDDIRESPSISVIDSLLERGLSVVAHDPQITHPPVNHPNFKLADNLENLLGEHEVVALLTEWPMYAECTPPNGAGSKWILDFRYSLASERWVGNGWKYATPTTK